MPEPANDKELLDEIKANFDWADEVWGGQATREKEDLRFQVAEYQWEDKERAARGGNVVGDVVVPARPTLSVSLLNQPVQLILNQAAKAHLGVEVHPVSEKANKENAAVKQGLYRRIERDSNAITVRQWALARAVQAGRGWYRVNTQYDEDSDHPKDQEIVIERILRQENVLIDPAAQRADFSDARWAMVVSWVPEKTFKRLYPNAPVPASNEEFKTWQTEDPHWVKASEKGKNAILVVENFKKLYQDERVTGVQYSKATARGIIEGPQPWAGKYIPLIPVFGRELVPFDEERRWEGIVRPARDGQKLFNYAASSFVEAMASEPKSPWMAAEGQTEGYEELYEQANVRNIPVIYYKPTTHEGQLVPPPTRVPVDTSRMGLSLQGLQQGKTLTQTSTSIYEPSLGELPSEPTAQSGRAIIALQQQGDAGSGHFLESLARVSMMYEAKVVLDLMPVIYDRPGRITQILGDNDKTKMVMIGKPFQRNPQGIPMPAIPAGGGQFPKNTERIDLKSGKYAISVSVGKSFQTRLQEGQAEIGKVLEAAPDLMPMIGDLYYRYRDFPGAQEIADRLEKIRKQRFPGLGDDEEPGLSLDQAKMKLQEQGQQIQQLQAGYEQAIRQLQADSLKLQADLLKTRETNASREAIAELKAHVDLEIAKLRESVKVSEGTEQRIHEKDRDAMESAHELGMAAVTSIPGPPRRPDLELEEPE